MRANVPFRVELDAIGDSGGQSFDPCGIGLIEATLDWCVEINNGAHQAVSHNRHDQLRPARHIAGDMPGEGMDILDELRQPRLCCRTTHTLSQGNSDTGRASDKWPQNQFPTEYAIESRPIQIGHEFPYQCCQVGHIGNRIALTTGQCVCRIGQLAIPFFGGEGRICAEIEHGKRSSPCGEAGKRKITQKDCCRPIARLSATA